MVKKRVLIGLVLLIIGSFLIVKSNANITGAVIGAKVFPAITSFIGVLFVIGSILILEKSEIETIIKRAPVVYLSEQAIQRSRKDRYVKAHLKKYEDEITRIAEEPEKIPQEIIGDFRVSPRGHRNIRIAWHMEKRAGERAIYIDDLLYHQGKDYVGKWNKRASKGNITDESYSGYRKYEAAQLTAD